MPDWIVNSNELEEEHQQWSWESGNYNRYRKHISVALGNTDEQHPFDVELTRLAPGEKPCPVHAHTHRWEFFIVVSGRAAVQRDGQESEAVEGDCFMQPAGIRHRIRNASDTEDLVYYVIANENPEDTGERFEV
jgi:mannose-6-phosphate isomerase-like protein (cupin superfamily)